MCRLLLGPGVVHIASEERFSEISWVSVPLMLLCRYRQLSYPACAASRRTALVTLFFCSMALHCTSSSTEDFRDFHMVRGHTLVTQIPWAG